MSDNNELQAVLDSPCVPVGFIPTPTMDYRAYRKIKHLTHQPAAPTPAAPAAPAGARALMWKQDPSVTEIGIRKVYLPGPVATGPRDARK